MNRETIRLEQGPFFVSGPIVDYDIEEWRCECRAWPIVVASTTYRNGADEWPKREQWFVRKCGICHQYPRPEENND